MTVCLVRNDPGDAQMTAAFMMNSSVEAEKGEHAASQLKMLVHGLYEG
jgi:hypothetical protein